MSEFLSDRGDFFSDFDKAGIMKEALRFAIAEEISGETGNLLAYKLNRECGEDNAGIARAFRASSVEVTAEQIQDLRADMARISEHRMDRNGRAMAATQAILKDKCQQLGIALG